MKSLRIILLTGVLLLSFILYLSFHTNSNTVAQKNSTSTSNTNLPKENIIDMHNTESFKFDKHYQAPELTGLTNWMNSQEIASIKDLKGKVVLVDFWTYSCINCVRTLPYLHSWNEKYAQDGLVILGIHTPEFAFEHIPNNVQQALKDYDIQYPVALDNDFSTWKNYKNHYWPAKYLIDKDGFVRYEHFGEGKYDETEKAITTLLNTETKVSDTPSVQTTILNKIKTPETYLGLSRRSNFVEHPSNLENNQWTLHGDWESKNENIVCKNIGDSIELNFTAAKANIVLEGQGTMEVRIDGENANTTNQGKDVKNGILQLHGANLYEVANFGEDYKNHTIDLRCNNSNTQAFAWTFG